MIEIAGATQELVHPRPVVEQEAPAPASASDLRRACLAVLRAEWLSLAIVGTAPGAPAALVASALADLASAYRLRPVRSLIATQASAAEGTRLQDELARARGGEERLVVTMDDPRTDPVSAAVLVHVDAAVLVVPLGRSELRSVAEAVALVGRERVLGCIVAR